MAWISTCHRTAPLRVPAGEQQQGTRPPVGPRGTMLARLTAAALLLGDAARAQTDPLSALPGDRPLSVFRRQAQDATACPDADVLGGSTVVADSGALYHVAESQTHAVRLTVGENAKLSGYRFWCYAPACTLEVPPCTFEQELGEASMALYDGLAPPEEGVATQIAGTVSAAITGCSAGWNTVQLADEAEPIDVAAGENYWLVFSHRNDWQTSYAPGTQLVRSEFGLDQDLTGTGFRLYDAHAPSSGVPLTAQLCDESDARACLDQCIGEDGEPQPDWSDSTASVRRRCVRLAASPVFAPSPCPSFLRAADDRAELFCAVFLARTKHRRGVHQHLRRGPCVGS